jgi:hypothetical protein
MIRSLHYTQDGLLRTDIGLDEFASVLRDKQSVL